MTNRPLIAIHKNKGSFYERWSVYCHKHNIPFLEVNCYNSNIIEKLKGIKALLWHHNHNNPKDIVFAKQLLFALEQKGIIVFPDFNSGWHFDDKIGQKYLLEAIGAPLIKTYVFYSKEDALQWIKSTNFPLVFKLRGGAGSSNVKLVKNKGQATQLIQQAFGKGFAAFDPVASFAERFRNFKNGKTNFTDLLKGLARFIVYPKNALVKGRENGYVYFQEFIKNNDGDIRVVVIGDKAFAIKRLNREKDFRASGSGEIRYDKSLFDLDTIALAFKLAGRLKTSVVAFDFLYKNKQPVVVEISYGFTKEGYDDCPGYWDQTMNWHEGAFDPYGWMIEDVLHKIKVEVNY